MKVLLFLRKVGICLSLLVLLNCVQGVSANGPVVSNDAYNIVTKIVVGTNAKTSANKPGADIAGFLPSIKNEFGYESIIPQASFYQSVGDGANISIKSMFRHLGSVETSENPVFTELNFGLFKVNETNSQSVGFKSFNFQARVPLQFNRVAKTPDIQTVLRYEEIMIALVNIRLELGKPKLIATLPLPDNGETLFFFVEVRKSSG